MPEESNCETAFLDGYSELHADIHNNLAVPQFQKWCKENGYGDIISPKSRMKMQRAIDSMNEFNEFNKHLVYKHGDRWVSFRFIDLHDISYETYSDAELGQHLKVLKGTVETLARNNKRLERALSIFLSILASIVGISLAVYLIPPEFSEIGIGIILIPSLVFVYKYVKRLNPPPDYE